MSREMDMVYVAEFCWRMVEAEDLACYELSSLARDRHGMIAIRTRSDLVFLAWPGEEGGRFVLRLKQQGAVGWHPFMMVIHGNVARLTNLSPDMDVEFGVYEDDDGLDFADDSKNFLWSVALPGGSESAVRREMVHVFVPDMKNIP